MNYLKFLFLSIFLRKFRTYYYKISAIHLQLIFHKMVIVIHVQSYRVFLYIQLWPPRIIDTKIS